MNEQSPAEKFKWEEARAAWVDFKRGLISMTDFWLIVRSLCSDGYMDACNE